MILEFDGIRGVDDQIEDHLVELRDKARDRPEVGIKIELDICRVLPSVRTHHHCRLDRVVDVCGLFLIRSGVGEVLHGLHDVGDPPNAFERLFDRKRDLFSKELVINFLQCGFDPSGPVLPAHAFLPLIEHVRVAIKNTDQTGKLVLQEPSVVADILRGCVNFVRDSRCQLPDGLKALSFMELRLQGLPDFHRSLEFMIRDHANFVRLLELSVRLTQLAHEVLHTTGNLESEHHIDKADDTTKHDDANHT